MKTYKLLVVYGLVFAILVGGIFTLQTRAPDPIQADVRITPFHISLEDPDQEEFRITLSLPNGNNHEDIDPDSILVEGVIGILEKEDWPKIKKNFFAFKVSGHASIGLMDIIRQKIWHMSPGPGERVAVDISVTGLVAGEAFEGTDTLSVLTEHNDNGNGFPFAP